MNSTKSFLSVVLFVFTSIIYSQDFDLDNWHHLSTNNDYKGISTNEAYELLRGITPEEIIVAVIDTGVDYLHEDLDDVMWINKNEIPNNQIDDDQNGYKDDIHGWNFLGNSKGENINAETLIETRIYAEHYEFRGGYSTYKKAVNAFFTSRENIMKGNNSIKNYYDDVLEIETIYHKRPIRGNEFLNFKFREGLNASKNQIINYLKSNNDSVENFDALKTAIRDNLETYKAYLEFYYNPEFNSRELIGDDYSNFSQRYYGNSDCKGPNSRHGTHVAGIIGAEIKNDIGVNGIANNVKIMSVRVVPNGDEHDKDVANAIYYAVNNGAKIINMSFGKAFSWNKQIVDDAIRYAEKNDVLLVHAAGNNAQELNGDNNFPNQVYAKRNFLGSKHPKNWIEVGAITYHFDKNFVASFSNFDSELVDIFAPGYQILSTLPESNYGKLNGTSMAAPMVSGVAAILRGYFPKLSAKKVKEIILNSGTRIDLKVLRPSDKEEVTFDSLSNTGAILNARTAVELALDY